MKTWKIGVVVLLLLMAIPMGVAAKTTWNQLGYHDADACHDRCELAGGFFCNSCCNGPYPGHCPGLCPEGFCGLSVCDRDSDCSDGNACTVDDCTLSTGLCTNTPIACDTGNVCVDGVCEPVCGDDICVTGEDAVSCPEDCDPCYGVVCPNPWQICFIGDCIGEPRCGIDFQCDPGYECDEFNQCVPVDPCADIQCQEGEVCVDGECVPEDPCADVQCAEGYHCDNGECVPDDPCADVECPTGQVCENGQCITPDPCADVRCPEGQRCVDGQCIYPPSKSSGMVPYTEPFCQQMVNSLRPMDDIDPATLPMMEDARDTFLAAKFHYVSQFDCVGIAYYTRGEPSYSPDCTAVEWWNREQQEMHAYGGMPVVTVPNPAEAVCIYAVKDSPFEDSLPVTITLHDMFGKIDEDPIVSSDPVIFKCYALPEDFNECRLRNAYNPFPEWVVHI